MTVTRTYARLPFHDLSAERFEDMCVQVVYRLQPWMDLQHYGAQGQDGGVDIYGEFIQDGLKKWVIQCKRYKTISAGQLKKIIDDFINSNNTIPDRYILIISCNPSRKTHEKFKAHAAKHNIQESVIISAATLEADLYARHPDLLYTFFGIQTNERRSTNVALVKHRLSLKKKVESSLMRAMHEKNREVIIHDVNRDGYPKVDETCTTIFSWFRLEYYRPYFRGISFYMSVVSILYHLQSGEWLIGEYQDVPPDGWKLITAFEIGNIPYDNIVDFDIEGDEFYICPHFYCRFDNLGEPYEEIWYKPTPEYQSLVTQLDRGRRLPASARKKLIKSKAGP